MPDLGTIGAAITSLKAATDIVKFLRDSDISLANAEHKLKLAELTGTLADARIELIEVQASLLDKDQKIAELENAFQNKDSLVRQYDAYYTTSEAGKAVGVPYCLRCWETDHKQRQLVRSPKEHRIQLCTACGHQYEGRLAGEIQAPTAEQLGSV